jgi:hypothetical protein
VFTKYVLDAYRGASTLASRHLFLVHGLADVTGKANTHSTESVRLPFGVWDHAQCPVAPCQLLPIGGLLVFGGRASSSSGFSEQVYLVERCPQQAFQMHALTVTCVLVVCVVVAVANWVQQMEFSHCRACRIRSAKQSAG